MTQVVKRDGKYTDFDEARIERAVEKAQNAIGDTTEYLGETTADHVRVELAKTRCGTDDQEYHVDIRWVQTLVENYLLENAPHVAKAYVAYRKHRDHVRESRSSLTQSINGLVNLTDASVVNENANKDAKVFPVQRDLLAGIISKHFAKNFIPADVLAAHEDGDLHYHDLDYSPFLPMTNCCLVDLRGMLENGFKLGNAQIESPKSIGVACAIMAQITAQVASHQYGGTTFANIDQVLAPYAEKTYNKYMALAKEWNIDSAQQFAEQRTTKEIHDGIQAYEYEVNTLFTTNGQQPFVTVSFGMGSSWFERELQKAILNVRIKGLGAKGLTAVFPKLVMFVEEGLNFNPEDPNYDIKQLALECSSKRLYPDIINAKLNREITGSSVPVSPMGCRSFLSVWKDETGVEILDGRNNLGVVSLNLPRIAIESQGDFGEFNRILTDRLALARRALNTRIDRFKGVKASVAPILYTEGAFGVRLNPDDEIIDLFRNGRSSISLGYIGLHEVGKIMFGSNPVGNPNVQRYLKRLVMRLKEETKKWAEESGFGFSLYSTPSESLCDRFCRLDEKKFGPIDGITTKGWYMNSFHLDVDEKVNPFDKIDFEKDYHRISNGGHISYCEFPNMRNNPKGLETVWNYAMSNLAYFGTNTPSDKCLSCGYEGEFKIDSHGFHCPQCQNNDSAKMSVIRRVCGYLGSPNARGFNRGKNLEVQHRVKHL